MHTPKTTDALAAICKAYNIILCTNERIIVHDIGLRKPCPSPISFFQGTSSLTILESNEP